MKRLLTLIIACVAFSVLVSCATQLTVREKEMKKYEKIDASLVEGMPEPIVKVVEAYNNEDYFTSAVGFYAIMKNKEWDRLHALSWVIVFFFAYTQSIGIDYGKTEEASRRYCHIRA